MGRRKHGLCHGRPARHKHSSTSVKLSKQAGRTIIRKHHQLSKALHDAESSGDKQGCDLIRQQLNSQGGLVSYQLASLLGQSKERGGDSSKVLVEWVKKRHERPSRQLQVLEVGALSTRNVLSQSPAYAVTRIDLNSQGHGILRQDFMERPLPRDDGERFDIISLSLVLNFVASKEDRGKMLVRTCDFLRGLGADDGGQDTHMLKPQLFLVLPEACLTNSRYMTESRFADMMGSIGYRLVERKLTSKLLYQLWEYDKAEAAGKVRHFEKVEVNAGKDRNNFCVVL